jgi:hypothetical protein
MKRAIIPAILGISLSLLCASLCAQRPTGSISGLVTDPSGAVISGAAVTVTQKATGLTLKLATTEGGVYTASSLLPAIYEVKVEAQGFKAAVLELTLEVGRVTPGDFRLEVGRAAETVNVRAHAVVVNPTQTALEGVITTGQIRDLPLNGRNFMDLGQLEPGVQLQDGGVLTPTLCQYTDLSIGSQSGEGTRITVDGLDISNETVGTNAMNVSQDSIQEFQISRSSLDISTNLTGTGAVNVVTKSGSNEVHGSGFLFWRDDSFAARIGQKPAPFDREQFGFSAGGPIIHDKLFWYANYERNHQNGASATDIPGFPQFTRNWAIPFDEEMAMGRADWNISSNLRAFFRFTHNFNDGIGTGVVGLGGTSLAAFENKDNVNQTAVGFDAAVGRFTHSLRFGYLNFSNFVEDGRANIPDFPASLDPAGRPLLLGFSPLATSYGSTTIGPSGVAPIRIFQRNREVRYDGSFTFGRHTLRWGGLINVIRVNWFASFYGLAPELDINPNGANRAVCGSDLLCYPVTSAGMGNGLGAVSKVPTLGFPYSGGKNTRLHWYVGDSWRVTSRINLNFGVRYVYEPGQNNPDLAKPALLDEFLPGLARRDRRDKNNFAPQLGFAWDPTGSGKWSVRAGAGFFYDTNVFNASLFEGSELLPPGISWQLAFPPFAPAIDPVTGRTIFDMNGADTNAMVTPGVNWITGCSDPRFPGGECPLETPGLIEAVQSAFATFKSASQQAALNFPSGPTIFEINRGTAYLLEPNYKTPYSFQVNVGIQRELRPGLVLSVDYLRQRGLHYAVARDYNRMGAADTLNVPNALAAMNALQSGLGCPLGPAGVNCAVASGATIEDYAANGLGMGAAASANVPNLFAFPGANPNFNSMVLIGSQGQTTYNALQASLRGRLPNVRDLIKNWTVAGSYSLSRLESDVWDPFFGGFEIPINNDHPLQFFGPTALDRTHMFSFASLFEIPGGVHLNSIWRANSRLPQSVFAPLITGSAAEIFYTDFNGDGTTGDPLPGTNRGSFGRSIGSPAALNQLVSNFNSDLVGTFTPAAQELIKAGLFTPEQLRGLGAVVNGGNSLPLAPANQVMLDSFITSDVRISRPFKFLGERLTVEPMLEWFNLFNVANYDLPGNVLSGTLTGVPGSINGTTPAYRPNRAGTGSGSFAQGIPRAWQLAVRVTF